MAEYNPDILQKYVDRLYLRATGALIRYVIIFIVLMAMIGAGVGYILYMIKEKGTWGSLQDYAGIGAFWGGVAGLIVGILIGSEKAFRLRLEAQRTLCLMQIEINTRTRDLPQ